MQGYNIHSMKRLAFLASFLLFASFLALGQIQYYGVDVKLDEWGKSEVKITLSFVIPVRFLNFTLPATLDDFGVYGLMGEQRCEVRNVGITYVNCELNLTPEKRSIEIRFSTKDFVKRLKDKYFFDAELGLKKPITSVFVSVTLPEGMGLVEGVDEKISMPEKASIVSDGRHIIVTWKLTNVEEKDSLRFQILYEKVRKEENFLLYGFLFGILGVAVVTGIYIKKLKKSEKLVLSVLDEYERKVIEVIKAHGGKVNQKKVVQETNLSKAKVSRVVKSLAERGLIEVERVGRTNILKLVRKKLEI